jgi:hypothetical protein
MELNMHTAQKDERNAGEELPDPRLNPMINPRLAKNLGRWANVYYTTPPEKRELAVLELLRELESAQSPEEEGKPPALVGRQEQTAPEEVLTPPACRQSGAPQRRFCGLCGSHLREDMRSEPEQHSSSPVLLPLLSSIQEGRDDKHRLVERHSVEIGMACEKRQSRKHVAFALVISTAIGSWGLWRMHLDPTPPQTASEAAPIPQRMTRQSRPDGEFRDHAAGPVAPAQPMHDLSKSPSKPAAGTPISCRDDHLGNCPVGELYQETLTLADGIDALFIDYHKRVTHLLLDAKAHGSDSANQQQNRLRQANFSAQLWERLQLGSYASREKYDALKYRAELTRRAILPRYEGRRRVNAYENPQSCLELHYIAEDLRRLAAKLPKPKITGPPSTRRAKSNSLSP